MVVSEMIGEIMRDFVVMILQCSRWEYVVIRVMANAEELKLSREFMSILLNSIHMESISRQNKVMNAKK